MGSLCCSRRFWTVPSSAGFWGVTLVSDSPHYELCLIKPPSDTVRAVDSGAPLTDTDHLRPEHTHAKTHCKIDAKHFSPSYTYCTLHAIQCAHYSGSCWHWRGFMLSGPFCFSAFMPLLAIKQALQEPRLVFVWVSHIWRASTAKHIFALNLIKPQLVFTPSTCQVGWQYHIILTQKNAELNRSAPSTLLRVLIWLQMDILTVTTGLCVVGWETSVQQSSTKPHCSPVGYTVKLMSLGK